MTWVVQKSIKTGPLIFRRWSKATKMICTIVVTRSLRVPPLSHVPYLPYPLPFILCFNGHVFGNDPVVSHWCFSLHSRFLTPAMPGLSRHHHNTFSNASSCSHLLLPVEGHWNWGFIIIIFCRRWIIDKRSVVDWQVSLSLETVPCDAIHSRWFGSFFSSLLYGFDSSEQGHSHASWGISGRVHITEH